MIPTGSRLGVYEIEGALGAGGMGEVYRARDTKLGRSVAVKMIHGDFVHDPERVARFQREAQLLAALNHPHIAQIYGFQDEGGMSALVMELVEGETLAERLLHGPIPVEEALRAARQVADALECAHEHGIVHRDLKPANVKVRPDGTVKVLDFGLAKLAGPADAGRDASWAVVTASPTITSPAMMTGAGMILGTAAYMSPEQARGKPVDKRADVWAFGCVLYEMLTGRRAFMADEVSDTLALVLMKEPDWSLLPTATPAAIRTLVRRCLEKERSRRLPDIGAARLEIDETLLAPSMPLAPTTVIVPPRAWVRRERVAWALAAIAAIAAAGIGAVHFTERPATPAAMIRIPVVPPVGSTFATASVSGQAISPDGRQLVFQVARGTQSMLAIRSFDADESRELAGTENATSTMFWSPDNRFVAFTTFDGKLKRIAVAGGPPQVLCDVTGVSAGGSWSGDTILFASGASGVLRVPATGGTPVPVTTPDAAKKESAHRYPSFLPDGDHFLYGASSGLTLEQQLVYPLYVGSLSGASIGPIASAESKAVYSQGFVLFIRGGTLVAQPFDPARLSTTGDSVVVAEGVAYSGAGAAAFSASATGVLSFRSTGAAALSQLVWVDRAGRTLQTLGDKMDQSELALSADGRRAALSVFDPARRSRDIWIHDLTRDLRTRSTFHAGEDWAMTWSPDGRRLAFSASRGGLLDIYQQDADGSGSEELLVGGGPNKYVSSWSPDGRFLLYFSGNSGTATGNDLWFLPLSGDRKPQVLVQTPFNEVNGQVSPDGRWVAYLSNESGRNEIYVVAFPRAGGKWQVSTGGGTQPQWRADGGELFYLLDKTLMAADVNGAGTAFEVGAVRKLFETRRRTEGYLDCNTEVAESAHR